MPCGESGASRLFVVDLERYHVDIPRLNEAQAEQHLYKYAMAQYILWLREDWDNIAGYLRSKWPEWRSQATEQSTHLRLPMAVASLYAGFDLGMTFALEQGVIEGSQARELSDRAWDCLINIASQQGRRVEEERLRLQARCVVLREADALREGRDDGTRGSAGVFVPAGWRIGLYRVRLRVR